MGCQELPKLLQVQGALSAVHAASAHQKPLETAAVQQVAAAGPAVARAAAATHAHVATSPTTAAPAAAGIAVSVSAVAKSSETVCPFPPVDHGCQSGFESYSTPQVPPIHVKERVPQNHHVR